MLEHQIQKEHSVYSNCSLHLDSLFIKKHVGIDKKTKKPQGFVDLGYGPTDDNFAKEILVFMAVGTTGHWKTPIAYFQTCGLSADTQRQLILQAISCLEAIGMKVQ